MTDEEITELTRSLQAALGDGYEVERPLGAGGFAVVFLVRDRQLKRLLAVKVLSPDIIASHAMIERFEREAQTIAQLSHPNIVPLHFVGRDGEMLYLAMAYVEGGTIADRIAGGTALSMEAASRLFAEMASALSHAHRRGVVHRDIKPHNILIEQETGRALLTDFGIARAADSQSLTASGLIMGTPAYLAPEQVAGEATDHRADIYALGTVMYEVLTGHQPFEATTPTAMMMKRLAGPPRSLREFRPEIPLTLLAVVDRCLAAKPEERFQNADEILSALAGRATVSAAVRDRAPVRRKWVLLTAGTVGISIAALVASFAFSGGEEPASPLAPAVDSGMVLIPEGDYLIGSDSGPLRSRPAHRVTLGAFGIGRTEVTVAEYSVYAKVVGVPTPWHPDSLPPGNIPVTGVQFSEAMNYCRWKHGDGGRLPSEEEWEAAARGLTGRRYPWGDASPRGRADVGLRDGNAPMPVGSFPDGATPEGVLDLIGSVWEWTTSTPRYYGADSVFGAAGARVIRGGAYVDTMQTTWHRLPLTATGSPSDFWATGFRCVMNPRQKSARR